MNHEKIKEMIEKALEARERSYSPYSDFRVGACVLVENGSLYTGSNIENAAYTPTVCAERVAIFKAVSEGHRKIKGIVVVGDSGEFLYPCGVCRQVMEEFDDDMFVVAGNAKGEYAVHTLDDLFPKAFGPKGLR